MSLPDLIEAVESSLVASTLVTETNARYKATDIGAQDDAQPPPRFGQNYIAIFPTGWNPGDIQPELMSGIDETYDITVAITSRYPQTSRETDYQNVIRTLYLDARRIMKLVHQNWSIIDTANAAILAALPSGQTTSYLIEWLRWKGTDPVPQLKDATWVWSDDDKYGNSPAAAVLEVRFGGARRIETPTDY